jgi:hypothetical protein
MIEINQLQKRSFTKSIIATSALIISGLFAFATVGIGIGGEGKKEQRATAVKGFTPIKTANGFTLKAGPQYKGSMIMGQKSSQQSISFQSVVTYQKGNTTYILPLQHKVQNRSSLEAVQVKVHMYK